MDLFYGGADVARGVFERDIPSVEQRETPFSQPCLQGGEDIDIGSGLTPASLAWILDQIEIDPNATEPLPGGVSPKELRTFVDGLISRLTRLAYPDCKDNAR